MEQLLGKTVTVIVPDRGPPSTGTVTSYDSASDSYLISYHNGGASHHFTSSQLASLLDAEPTAPADPAVKPRRGRPVKRKRLRQRGSVGLGNVDGDGAFVDRVGEDCSSAAAVRSVEDLKGKDDALVCDVPVNYGSVDVEKRKLGFDLNLAAKEAVDDQMVESRTHFDLNLGCDQVVDVAVAVAVDGAQIDLITTFDGATTMQEAKLKKPKIGRPSETLDALSSGISEAGEQDSCLREITARSSLTVSDDGDNNSPGHRLKEVPSPDIALVNSQLSGDSVAYQSGTRGRRKRRQPPDDVKPRPEPVLRRSARKNTPTASLFDLTSEQNCGGKKTASFLEAVDVSSSNLSHNLTKLRSPCEEIEDAHLPQTKLQLPESSQFLNLDGISMLNLISIYSFLRSFSTVLFLSPFELEDFCEALKCKSPTSLFDQTHVAILQILRKHLQFLSAEGSQSASDCLRSLNWDFLDPVTWPLFITEYLLIMKPDFDIKRLNLVETDYYNLTESLKVEVLSILCDDLVDAECIRVEINRRSLIDELEPDPRVTDIRDSKRRKANVNFLSASSLTGEIMDVTNDWNSDECCLCKLDGSLICCDGCPAAYHSRCVGVASDLLPEGDWYCPECKIDRGKSWSKHRVSLRGAESLGVDPDGRRYFGSGGCLLVLDSHEDNSAISYYCKSDIHAVIKVLKSSDIRYGAILNAIALHWDISVYSTETKTDSSSQNRDVLTSKEDIVQSQPLGSLEICSDRSGIGQNQADLYNAISFRDHEKMVYQITSSEGSAEISHARATIQLQNSENSGGHMSKGPAEVANRRPELPDNCKSVSVPIMNDSSSIKLKQNQDSPAPCSTGLVSLKTISSTEGPTVIYSNCYRLAQVASSVAEDLFGKRSDKSNKLLLKSNEENLSCQLKAIVKKCSRFCWSSMRNVKFDAQTENCGWCYCCKSPDVNMDCLFRLNYSWPAWKDFKSQATDNPSAWCGRGHLFEIISYVLFIESRLQGLLLGPWLNPQHSTNWTRSVLKSSDLASVKYALLTLESNLHHLAFSAEWFSYMDSAHMMGSASYVVTSSSCLGLKHGVSRKRGRSRHADPELLPIPNAASDMDFFWWRGGRISRHVFNWKVLPRSSALKAARQAGGHKIPGIYYPEASEFAKRRKDTVWRAAIENSSSVEQLAFLMRELDSNIKWDDIENSNPFTKIDKKLTKASRLFKKVTIRRKKLEGTVVKYLLDFGKRKVIPDIVVTHGSMFEESASERKKYWLEESLVPMHMMKSFEENRICRKNYKMKSGKHFDVMLKKGCSRPRDFSYLFSRAEKLETCECGHCKKSVPIRESVRCQFCEGYFHKRHARKSKGKDFPGDRYSCLKCYQDNLAKVETKTNTVRTLRVKFSTAAPNPGPQGKIRVCSRVGVAVKSRSDKGVMQIPLRRSSRKIKFKYAPINKKKRSPRKSKFVSVGSQKAAGRKRGRPAKAKKPKPKKVEEVTPRKKRRTQVQHTYWLNGLKLTKNPDDVRIVKFRKEKLLVPSEDLNIILNQPICTICSQFTSHRIYICCEVCEGWFHGKAFGVDAKNTKYLIGFRCHSCCNRKPPVCSIVLERELDGIGNFNKNKCGSGVEYSPSDQLCVESSQGRSLSGHIGKVVSCDGKSVAQNPNQVPRCEEFVGAEFNHTEDDSVSKPHADMGVETQTQTSEHCMETRRTYQDNINSISLDPATTSAPDTNFGMVGPCNGVTETEATPESSGGR